MDRRLGVQVLGQRLNLEASLRATYGGVHRSGLPYKNVRKKHGLVGDSTTALYVNKKFLLLLKKRGLVDVLIMST